MDKITYINPATGEALGHIEPASPEKVQAAIQRAQEAFKSWSKTTVSARLQYLERGRVWLNQNIDSVVNAISLNNGKPKVESLMADIAPVLSAITYYKKNAEKVLADEPISVWRFLPTKRAYLSFSPLGVIGIISPWNYPYQLPMGEILSALVAGDCVILKPSEVTSLVNKQIQAFMDACQLPAGVFQMVEGDGLTGAALCSGNVQRIVFTGSVQTGKKVMKAAAENLTPVSLELGGKDPAIVLDDVNIDIASSGVLVGGYYNNGQTCCSIERLLVDKKIEGAFISALEAKIKKLRVGPSTAHDNEIGPITYGLQKKVIKSQLDDIGGAASKLYDGQNNFLPPVLLKTNTQDTVWNDETFGPVICYDTFETEDEAIEKANRNQYGLAAVIWSGSTDRAKRLARRIEAGTVVINDAPFTNAVAPLPWGGIKHSGIGKVHGKEGLRDMCLQRVVAYDIQGQAKQPWWYPYSKNHYDFLKAFALFSSEAGLTKLSALAQMLKHALKLEKRL